MAIAQVKQHQPFELIAGARIQAALEGRGLTKRYGGRAVVDDVDVRIGHVEVVGLLGPNGAGKTTTFYMLVGLLKPTRGAVFLGTENITSKPMHLRARMGS